MEKSNLAVKRERQEEDNENDGVREDGETAVAVETSLFLNLIFPWDFNGGLEGFVYRSIVESNILGAGYSGPTDVTFFDFNCLSSFEYSLNFISGSEPNVGFYPNFDDRCFCPQNLSAIF